MKGIRHITLGLMLAFCLVFIAGCSTNGSSASTPPAASETAESSPTESAAGKPIVAVSIVPQQALVEAVCGDLAEVITMVPPGNSPGNYEPTPAQLAELSDAVMYFTIGIPTETANILPEIPDVAVVSFQDAVGAVYPDRTFASGGRDPHIWLSVKRAIVMVETIADAMGELDAANKATYQSNAAAYIEQLEAVDQEISAIFDGIANKEFIVYHPAFGYFADDYGLTMYELEEGGKDATPVHLQDVIDLAKEKSIKVIYVQQEIDSSQADAFAEEIGGEAVQLAPLSGDYINNLRDMAKTLAENFR